MALSGGGDSLALLEIAATWARQAGRRLLAVTVDHGLNPQSLDWSRRCEAMARAVGAHWLSRRWEGPRPTTGLPAAARRARHALVSDAAREAGASVVLFGQTADDVAEGDWMRARGGTLGGLHEWTPSPAWPEGRGLMLLRPMLEERREALRELLRARGREWIEDPGNEGYGRGRARAALREGAKGHAEGPSDLGSSPRRRPDRSRPQTSRPLPLGEGFDGVASLVPTLLCAAGHDRLPRAGRVELLEARLATGDPFTATLAGARIDATPQRVVVAREAGELRRSPSPPLRLVPDRPAVWDGRYEITAAADGWSVLPALGRLAQLSDADRAVVARSPAAARGTLPVLIRDGSDRPVLAWRAARVLSLAPRRLMLALGETTQEMDLTRTVHGETPPSDLF